MRGVVSAREPADVAGRGAQGAGRRRAHVRHHHAARPATASTSTPTCARRSTAASPAEFPDDRRGRGRDARPGRHLRRAARSTTYFFSTSGGRTENVENSFVGADPKPWLKGVEDPFDRLSPKHRWGPLRFTAAQVQRKLGRLVQGRFKRIKVTQRGASPRVVRAHVVGTRRHDRGHRPAAAPRLRPERHLGLLPHDRHGDREGSPHAAVGHPARRSLDGRRVTRRAARVGRPGHGPARRRDGVAGAARRLAAPAAPRGR